MDDINTSDTLAGEVDVTSTDGGENDSIVEQAVSTASQDVMEVKDLLNEVLGGKRKFTDNESALKSVKDTFDFVGKAGKYKPLLEKLEASKGGEKNVLKLMEEIANGSVEQTAPAPISSDNFVSKEEFKQVQFFAEHPEYKEHKDLISSMGKDPEEVVKSEVFKKAYTAIKTQQDIEESKSVLHSNSRLGQVTDKLTQAREALQSGNEQAARSSAVSAVLEAYK